GGGGGGVGGGVRGGGGDEDGRGGEDDPAGGQLEAGRLEDRLEPYRDRKAEEEPDDRADQADHARLQHDRAEHLAPGGAERAQGRQLAQPLRDRDRERVGDHEAADEQGDPGKAEQDVPDRLHARLRVLAVRARLGGRGLHLRRHGEQRADLAYELRIRDTLFGLDADQVELALLVEKPLRGREVEHG